MTDTADMKITGLKHLERQLKRLRGDMMKKAARSGVRAAAKPILEEAKRLTPVKSGRLRASLGIAVSYNRAQGEFIASIGPRRHFQFTDTEGRKRAVVITDKQKAAKLKRGIEVERVPVSVYAYGIEFGVKSNGALARRAGGARMLRKGLQNKGVVAKDALGDALAKQIKRVQSLKK